MRAEFDQVEHGRNDLRVEYAAQKKEEEEAQADAVRIREECGQVYGELPETYRVASPRRCRPTGWRRPIRRVRPGFAAAEAAGLSAARQLLQQAEQVRDLCTIDDAGDLQTPEIARLQKELPADPREVRREHARLETDEKSLEKSLTVEQKEVKEIEKN